MKKTASILLLAAASTFLFSSCVSNKRYMSARNRANRLQEDSLNLANQSARLSGQVEDLQGRVRKMESLNSYTSSQLNMSQEQIASQNKRLQQMQALIERQQQASNALRNKIAEALNGFNSNQLTVTMKNGKVYVSLQESLLFPSGSAVVNADGKRAVSTLASVLNQNPDINVDVEGHTDSVALGSKNKFQDNWELSVARSTAIARIMIDEYKVDPMRVVASGHSKYDPVASNATPEGRAANRRTEIILEPKLDELLNLMSAN